MTDLLTIGRNAKQASQQLSQLSSSQKNTLLQAIAQQLKQHQDSILAANEQDMKAAKSQGLTHAMLDRLLLNHERLQGIINDIDNVIALADPIGNETENRLLANGLELKKRSIPLGVLGVIYEARPNVTVDISVLALKAGNAAILRGGRETRLTNLALLHAIECALTEQGVAKAAIQLISDPNRALVGELLRLDQYVDMIIPRGGPKLQQLCLEQATIPVITGGIGICHLYLDKHADFDKSLAVIVNAKVQRPTVCNALDTLLIHSDIDTNTMASMLAELERQQVQLKVCERVAQRLPAYAQHKATAVDFDQEWLSLVLGVKLVDDVDAAIEHISQHSSGHSEAILSDDNDTINRFVDSVQSAAVYVNASTRFTDGAEFGLGAEVAVSTQKLHARGPMGLEALTSYKWIANGNYTPRS
ncbi:glutamate-5-semialdehyde dehydrogenase [Paraferrimonas haliotis]|uniref:Gamma-glutamyl phosphate reductase n=1 Tax=Paraferrimonas haliotis TaxID=2013866 RepID=A0AA37TQZ2_9GAMM|nr:glutamate-5-semialdehyde dehydrogenase [Paraferrimonas haliotis]GLS83888.1 gamma-glutamyl phosphate reductase [Paraferrimonas haliotis]GLS84015.1 gamma-glutamyl phosphate reductase [Paraferrimonas haliotis]